MRKLSLVVLLILAMAGRSPSPGHAVPGPVQQGDVNCDAAVNAVDSLQILRDVAGLGTTAACLADAGDVNCDAAVNSIDALRILRHVAGLTNTTPDGCTPIGEALGGDPSSEDLIDAALAADEIDAETALVYKVYAAFGDSRLPAPYKGDDGQVEDSGAVRQAAIQFDSLSPEHQAIVAPFLLPPYAPGSWLELQSIPQVGGEEGQPRAAAAEVEWTTYPAVGGKVKVWAQDRYLGDAEKAQGIAAAMTGKIWAKLVSLTGPGHEPLSDAGLANNGGDGALDIVLVHMEERGVALPSDPNNACQLMPDYININSARPLGDETHAGLIQTATHETFHTIQDTYPLATGCWAPEYAWFTEASAKWVEDYVYPDAKSEHPYANYFLKVPGLSLNDVSGSHEYGAYLLPFFLARKYNQPLIVRTIWENFGSTANSLQAVDDALQEHLLGDFDARWPEFALYNWNRPPVDNYQTWDSLTTGADTVDSGIVAVTLGGAASRDFEVSADVSYLAALYHHFSFGDEEVKSVVFDNTIVDYPHAKVQALVKIGGAWKEPEDWTHDAQKTFCRDIPSQHIEDLVIIISYSNWEDEDAIQQAEVPKLTARSAACTDWEGTATVSTEDTVPGGHAVVTMNAHVRFEADLPPGMTMCGEPGKPPIACERYSVAAGELTYSSVVQAGDCTWTIGPGTVSLPHTPPEQGSDGFLIVYTGADPQTYYGGGQTFFMDTLTVACGETASYPSEAGGIWFQAAPGMFTVKNHGQTIDDTYTEGNTTWHWHFDPAPPE